MDSKEDRNVLTLPSPLQGHPTLQARRGPLARSDDRGGELLGVHCSASGGMHNACLEAASLGIDTFQVFTKNQRQWKERRFSAEDIARFSEEFKKAGIRIAFSHGSYLINLAGANKASRCKAVEALIGEVNRCHDLGLAFTVLHPGFPKEMKTHDGIRYIAEGLKTTLTETSHSEVKILVENMAGQGSAVGGPFIHLHEILSAVGNQRIACCFDTCHAFAAGYDLRTKTGFEETIREFDKVIGLGNLLCIHLNDSKGTLGSHLDRHEHIGHGEIGLEPFKVIMQMFLKIPKVLETPKEKGWDARNLNTLREFIQ